MKASFSARGRPLASVLQTLLIGAILLVGVSTSLMFVYFYIQLFQTINQNLRPSSDLLPQISALRSEVALFHADAVSEINTDVPNYIRLFTERDSVQDRVNTMRAIAPASEEYATVFTEVEAALAVFDAQTAILRAKPTETTRAQVATATFEMTR